MPQFGNGQGSEYAHSNPNIKPAHAAFGEPVRSTGLGSAPAPGNTTVAPAGLFSTAHYVPKEPKAPPVVADKRICQHPAKDGGVCKGSPMKGSMYCVGHARMLGLAEPGHNQWTKPKETEGE